MTSPADEPQNSEFEPTEYLYDPAERLESDSSLGSQVWVDSPGYLRLPKEPVQSLLEAHFLITGDRVKYVNYVRAAVRGALLYLIPTNKGDARAAEVSWYRSTVRINLSALLKRAKVAVPTGYSELYPCSLDEHSPYGPALVVNLTKYHKRRPKGKKKPA